MSVQQIPGFTQVNPEDLDPMGRQDGKKHRRVDGFLSFGLQSVCLLPNGQFPIWASSYKELSSIATYLHLISIATIYIRDTL